MTGYSKIIDENTKLWKLMRELRSEIDFEAVDAWKPDMGVRYRGCEPIITSYNPVKCNQNLK